MIKLLNRKGMMFLLVSALLVVPAKTVGAESATEAMERAENAQSLPGEEAVVYATTESDFSKTWKPHTDVTITYFASYVNTNTPLLKDKISARVTISGPDNSIDKYYGYATPAFMELKGNKESKALRVIAYYENPVGTLSENIKGSNTFVEVTCGVQETTYYTTTLY